MCNDTSTYTQTLNLWATGTNQVLPLEGGVRGGLCTVLPNPATNQAQLYHQLPENETATFNLYNTMGTLVNTTTLNGNGVYKLNTANYQPGLYYYTLSSHNNLLQRGTLVITR
ncbi:MAG: T9SS type A sorting domain-containing protein [Sphingobacteriales bacterium]|nr:T9SS type A sorting domain-containing protein [Sphingobacteriales bacterium]